MQRHGREHPFPLSQKCFDWDGKDMTLWLVSELTASTPTSIGCEEWGCVEPNRLISVAKAPSRGQQELQGISQWGLVRALQLFANTRSGGEHSRCQTWFSTLSYIHHLTCPQVIIIVFKSLRRHQWPIKVHGISKPHSQWAWTQNMSPFGHNSPLPFNGAQGEVRGHEWRDRGRDNRKGCESLSPWSVYG